MAVPDPFPSSIRRLAGIAQAVATLGMALLIGAAVWQIYLSMVDAPAFDQSLTHHFFPEGAEVTIGKTVRLAGLFLLLIPIGIQLFAMDSTRRLFVGYRAGEIFTSAAAGRLSRIGWALIALAAVWFLTESAGIALLTAMNPPGERQVGVYLDEGMVLAVIFGLLLVVVGRILAEAARLSEEVNSFV